MMNLLSQLAHGFIATRIFPPGKIPTLGVPDAQLLPLGICALTACSFATSAIFWKIFGAKAIAKEFSASKDMPHYKYLIRPLYKRIVPYTGTAIATLACFLATDFLMHQIPTQLGMCVAQNLMTLPIQMCDGIYWLPWTSAIWLSFALPVLYAKMQHNKAKST